VVSLINGANQYVATRVFRLGADVFGLSKQPSIITNVDDWLDFRNASVSLPTIFRPSRNSANRAKASAPRSAGALKFAAASTP
jgi:putative ABC transport system permease protein